MKEEPLKKALGVDIGNVIIDFRSIEPDFEVLEENYSGVPAAPGVFEALKQLNEYFKGDVYLISKATEWAQARILKWFEDNKFFKKTGLKLVNVHFCGERHEKDAICQNIGVTHFIDDRLEVLNHMIESTPHLYAYRPNVNEVAQFKGALKHVKIVESWEEVAKEITAP